MPKKQRIELTLDGRVIVQKNSKRVFNGRVVHSQGFLRWQPVALNALRFQKAELANRQGVAFPLKAPYRLELEFTMKGKLDSDGDGMQASIQDALEHVGIIENDKMIDQWGGRKERGGVGFFTRIIVEEL